MRELLLTIHIVSVAAWLGGDFGQLFVLRVVRRRGGETAATWFRALAAMGSSYFNIAGALVFVTGIAMLLLDNTIGSFSSTFVTIGFITVIVGGAMGVLFFVPRSRATADQYESGDTDGADQNARAISWGLVFDAALVTVTIAAMVGKWGL